MQQATDIAVIILLAVIVYQDFRFKAVSWWLFPLLSAAFIAATLPATGITNLLQNFLFNLGFVALQFLAATLYFSIKNRALTSITDVYIGKGDMVLFLSLCLLFSPANFIIFMVTALLLVTVVAGICLPFIKKSKEIPLAGAVSLLLTVAIVFRNIYTYNFYDDSQALLLLNSFMTVKM